MATGRKGVSIRDVAHHVGVDPSTVSLALNGSPRVADSTRLRVVDAARELGYRPNAVAQALRRGSTRSVGLLAASLDIPFFVELLKAQERWLVDHDYSVRFANLHCDAGTETRIVDAMRSQRVDGICIGYPSFRSRSLYREVSASGVQLSFYAEKHHLSWVDGCSASVAVCDLSHGCFALLEHLYRLGHRRIAYMGYLPDRELDYRQSMHELGLRIDSDWILAPDSRRGDLTRACVRFLALNPRPTAIFAQSDEWAARVINALVARGIRVPADVSVVGVNNDPLGEMIRVPLTTLALPTQDIGTWMAQSAAEGVESETAGLNVRFFPTKVVIRESSAAPPV